MLGARTEMVAISQRARNIFAKVDRDQDGRLTEAEFVTACLQDSDLARVLAPHMQVPENFS